MILIDAHTWIWRVQGDDHLTPEHGEMLGAHDEVGIGVSAFSCWEIAKLVDKGKITLPDRTALRWGRWEPNGSGGREEDTMKRSIQLDDARAHLAELIEKAARGEEVIVQAGENTVKIVPCAPPEPRPTFGSAKGLIEMSEDFDEPLEDFEPYMF